MLTLTSQKNDPETNNAEAIKRDFQKLVKRWRRRGQFEYMGVIERGKGGMVHIHVVGYGDFIPQEEISRWWQDVHGAKITYIESVRHYMERKKLNVDDLTLAIKLMIGYVTKYLSKQNLSKRVLKSRKFDSSRMIMERMAKRLHNKIVQRKFRKFMERKYQGKRVYLLLWFETEKLLHFDKTLIEAGYYRFNPGLDFI